MLTEEQKKRLVTRFLERVMPYVLHTMPGGPSNKALTRIRETASRTAE